MSRTEQVELTTLCMVYRGEELLLQNRVKTDWRGYCFPGGHVEPGETVVASVIREVQEETGVTYEVERLAVIHENFFGLKWQPAYVYDPQAETDGFFFCMMKKIS